MPETNPTQEPDDLPTLYHLPVLQRDSHGDFSGPLTVVTEDGRLLRITGVRYLDGHQRTEMTVAEEVD